MQDQTINLYGIDESRPVFSILGTAVGSVVNIDSNGDGDIQLLEVLNAVQNVAVKVIRRIPNLPAFRQEAMDYSENEKEELIMELATATGLEVVKARVLFQRGAKLVLDIFDFVIDARRPASDFEQDPQV